MTEPFDMVVALLVAAVLALVIVSRIRAALEEPEARFLVRTFLWALALRYGLALFLNVHSADSAFAVMFWGDSGTYDLGGYLLSLYWSGRSAIEPSFTKAVSGFGFHYFVGALYSLFGRNHLLVQLVNGTIGALSAVVIYAIARRIFDAQAARWAAMFMAFFPQMVFWSAGMYKDPAVLLCIALSMYAVLRLQERFAARHLLLFVAAGLALMTLRFYVFYVVAFATLGTFAFAQRGSASKRLLSQAALVAVFLGALSFAAQRERIEDQTSYFDLRRLEVARQDQTQSARSGYAAERNVSTPAGALAALPVGLVYLLFAPFPWEVRGLRQALTVPETLVWYALMPALLRGLRYTVRHRLRESLPILVFTAMLTAAYAIAQGNIGTAYRQRTQVTMFFFIFIAVGLVQKRRGAEDRLPAGAAGQRLMRPSDVSPPA